MSLAPRLAIAALMFQVHLWAQTSGGAPQVSGEPSPPQAVDRDEPLYLELNGFDNFVNNNYGRWKGGGAKIMYRGAKHFAPIFGFATQKRPEGSDQVYGLDSYLTFNKWFYLIGGISGSPEGTAILFPRYQYGVTAIVTVPGTQGLAATLAASQNHGDDEGKGRIFSVGALYYCCHGIWSGNISFNRSYPGAVPSKSGGLAVQFGAQNKFWIGGGMSGGRIAYQTIALRPLDVRFMSFGPNFFYQQWINGKVGFIVKYDYQNQLEAYQRHGISASLFFEFP
ncbi:MAG: YaiO family outer membrane beta-barrel protein [Acidobacteria bacterium]|nr:YaiO family outer membrane beta-barrel protein [Acidobacteriota bacterium]